MTEVTQRSLLNIEQNLDYHPYPQGGSICSGRHAVSYRHFGRGYSILFSTGERILLSKFQKEDAELIINQYGICDITTSLKLSDLKDRIRIYLGVQQKFGLVNRRDSNIPIQPNFVPVINQRPLPASFCSTSNAA
jgi:hypothetical protein